jgi:hypothetical protein
MKRKNFAQFLSAILSILFLINCIPNLWLFAGAISSQPGPGYTPKHYSNDFDSADSLDDWTTTGISSTVLDTELPYRTPEDLSASPEDINNVLIPAYRLTSNSIATLLDSSVLPTGKIMSYCFKRIVPSIARG